MPSDRHQLVARTEHGNFRVGSKSEWKYAQSRWAVATHDGSNTNVTVRAFVDGRWQDFPGHLAVRSVDDPAFADLPVANDTKATGTDRITVRAADFRKIR